MQSFVIRRFPRPFAKTNTVSLKKKPGPPPCRVLTHFLLKVRLPQIYEI